MYQSDLHKFEKLGIDQVPTELRNISLDQLQAGVWQQRWNFDEASLGELANSMRVAGKNVVPAIVTRHPSGGFSIIAGERRWRAAALVGLPTLQCIVGAYTFEQASYISIVENLQREDLNPIEEATSYQLLQERFDISHEEIGQQIGKSRSHVTNYLRLLKLDIQVRDALIRRELTAGQARPLCTLDHHFQQRRIAENAIRKGWPVTRISKEVASVLQKPVPVVKLSDNDPDLRRLEREISETVGLECVVKRSAKGQWQLGFNAGDDDTFSGLLERLGVKTDADL